MFQSPYGVMDVNHAIASIPEETMKVSVPLRGNGCESVWVFNRYTQGFPNVSVPLRGNGCESLAS